MTRHTRYIFEMYIIKIFTINDDWRKDLKLTYTYLQLIKHLYTYLQLKQKINFNIYSFYRKEERECCTL